MTDTQPTPPPENTDQAPADDTASTDSPAAARLRTEMKRALHAEPPTSHTSR